MNIKDRFIDYLLDNKMLSEYMEAVKSNGYEFDDLYDIMESKGHLKKLIAGVLLILEGDTKKKKLNTDWKNILEMEFFYSMMLGQDNKNNINQ